MVPGDKQRLADDYPVELVRDVDVDLLVSIQLFDLQLSTFARKQRQRHHLRVDLQHTTTTHDVTTFELIYSTR